jgi:hypothetical protein
MYAEEPAMGLCVCNLNHEMGFERQIFSLSPQMSNVSEKVMAAAPDFWRPKATMAKRPWPLAK